MDVRYYVTKKNTQVVEYSWMLNALRLVRNDEMLK